MTMPDREKVIKGLEHCDFGDFATCHECPYYQSHDCTDELKNDILVMLKEQETANVYKCPNCGTWVSAENVVRCKDCKHWLPMNRFVPDYHPGKGECELNCWVRNFDWFCADGERKEDL